MSKRLPIRWSRRALEELDEVLGYIAEHNAKAAHRFRVSIVEGLEQSRDYPKIPRMVPEEQNPNVREVLREPFRIIYEIHPKELRVLAIRRMERAPLGPDDLQTP